MENCLAADGLGFQRGEPGVNPRCAATLHLVMGDGNSFPTVGDMLIQGQGTNLMPACQCRGKVLELSGKLLVQEENAHLRPESELWPTRVAELRAMT